MYALNTNAVTVTEIRQLVVPHVRSNATPVSKLSIITYKVIHEVVIMIYLLLYKEVMRLTKSENMLLIQRIVQVRSDGLSFKQGAEV